MVFERFTDCLSWGWFFRKPSMVNELIEEGFDEREAKHLSFLIKSQYEGKALGLFVGAFVAYTWDHWFSRITRYLPQLAIRQALWKPIGQAIILLGFTFMGDYTYTSHRNGANNWLGNMLRWNNNLYQRNKQDFIANFRVLDRKFTAEEIQQFNEKRQIMDRPNRRWIYNPLIHGSEEEFNEKVQRLNSRVAPWNQPKIIEQIKSENYYNPRVHTSLFKLKDHLDITGVKYNLKQQRQVGWTSV